MELQETEAKDANELRVGDEFTHKGQIYIVNHIYYSKNVVDNGDDVILFVTICDNNPSRTLTTFTFPSNFKLAVFK